MERTRAFRFALIILSSVLAILIAYYRLNQIPEKVHSIALCNEQIGTLQQKLNEVNRIDSEIDKLKRDWIILANLDIGRMKYGRLLEKLAASLPKGAWIRSISVTPTTALSSFYRTPLGGKRYDLKLVGYTVGETDRDADARLAELLSKMRSVFGIPNDEPSSLPSDWGFNQWLGARFDPPTLLGSAPGTGAGPAIIMTVEQQRSLPTRVISKEDYGDYADIKTEFVWPTVGLPFSIRLRFEMPTPMVPDK